MHPEEQAILEQDDVTKPLLGPPTYTPKQAYTPKQVRVDSPAIFPVEEQDEESDNDEDMRDCERSKL